MIRVKNFVFNPFMENTFVVTDEATKQTMVIDAGCLDPHESMILETYIKDEGLALKYVLNTHLHLDHQFGNKALFNTFGIAPMAHADDEFMLPRMAAHCSAFGISINQDDVQPLGRYVTDAQLIQLGDTEVKVIATPGHSPGGVCYYIESEGVVFTGDTLFRMSIGRTDLPRGDYDTLMGSIKESLLTLPDTTRVYCGHGESTTIGDERQFNGFLK